MSYKLYYFDARGRGEIIRLIFAAADTKFEDIRFSFEEWPAKYKAASPTGVAPYLVDPVTGKTLVQSFAIARLLATRFGFMSSDPYKFYKIERTLAQLKDIQEAAVPAVFNPDEKAKAAAKKDFLEVKAPGLLATLAKFLAEESSATSSKLAVGDSLTLADLAVIAMTDFVEVIGTEAVQLLAKYPELAAHRQQVLASNKSLAEYIANRKPAQF